MTENRRRRRGDITGPIILIVIGVIFLLGNMGLLEEGIAGTFRTIWPILFLLLGVSDFIRKKGVFGPVFWVGMGSVFLFANIGWLEVHPLLTLLRLWPLLIIAVGMEIIFGRRSYLAAGIGILVMAGLFAGGLWFSERALGAQTEQLQEVSVPLDDLLEASIWLGPPVASLQVYALEDSNALIEGTYSLYNNEPQGESLNVEDGTATYRLRSDLEEAQFGVWNEYGLPWEIGITGRVPVDLDLDLGVGEASIDLLGLDLSGFSFSAGVGEAKVWLPAGEYRAQLDAGVGLISVLLPNEGDIRLDLDLGVGEIVIEVPAGMPVRIHLNRGLAGLQVPGDYTGSDDVYTSPGYTASGDHVDIYVDIGVGSIVIREK